MSKSCNQCNIKLPLDNFSKGRNQCKSCDKINRTCSHGKTKALCRECGGTQICSHGNRKYQCKECGGSQICTHGRRKSICRECGGSAFCSHGIQKTKCRECGGSAFCIHGNRKYQCKECGGSAYCSHGIQKAICRKCGGTQICSHGNQKCQCKECGGSQICIHGRRKSICRECGGSQICSHGIQKTKCRECGGSAFCIHGNQKYQCKECGGSAYCTHGNRKHQCKECGGSQICIHDKGKYNCIICNPNCACTNCKSVFVHKNTNFYPLCQACFCNEYPDHKKSTLYKIKERYLRDELRLRFPEKDINMVFDKAVDGGCSKKRPDVLIDLLLYSIIIECDEGQHKKYECENKRTMHLFEDLGNRPLIMIRFNPDSYTEKRKKVEGCFKPLTKIEDIHKKKFYELNEEEWKRRINILEEVIKGKISSEIPQKEIEEIKLFYNNI